MINNVLNEFSTNDSATLSPSRTKEFQIKHQKNIFQNFLSFNTSFNKNQTDKITLSRENLNFPKNENDQKIQNNSNDINQKIKKRITKKIIKKKIRSNSSLLDFDFLIKELFENKNLKNDFSRKVGIYQLSQIESRNKNMIGKKRKKFNSSFSNKKENGKKSKYYITILKYLKFS